MQAALRIRSVSICHRALKQRCLFSASSSTGGSKKFGNLALGLASGTFLTTAGAITYMNNHVGGSEGLVRTISFYSLAIPKYIQYRAHMILESPDEVWDELHKETSKAGLDKIMELQGFYVKSGQMAAANIGNAFPKIWQDTMSVLQDECPSESFDVVKSIVESEYGCDLYDVFETFEETPIGAASIGQVHRATLNRDGSKVVVKVMYPGVENVFRGDVRTIKMFCEVAQPVHVAPLIEIEKQFMTEFDYVLESQQLDKVRKNMMVADIAGEEDSSKLCAIPKPHLDLCTKRILVMNELNGKKLVTELQNDMNRQMERMNKSLEKLGGDEAEMQKSFTKEFALGENGPTSEQYEALIKLLDAKRRAVNAYAALYNYSIGLIPGTKRKVYQDKSSLPINHAKLIDDLLYIHGHQVLVDGVFNGDPHPGNILLLGVKEGKPQLGLIDYGQVKTLSREERLVFCRLILALADDDKDAVVKALKEAGYKSQKMDEDIMYTYARVAYDEDNETLTQGKHIQLFMEQLHDSDPVEHLPQQYILASRVSILLRGLGHAVHQSRSVAKAWRPIAEKVLREEGEL